MIGACEAAAGATLESQVTRQPQAAQSVPWSNWWLEARSRRRRQSALRFRHVWQDARQPQAEGLAGQPVSWKVVERGLWYVV
eukprot:scaffold38150_cov65-Phaeocystis_antarctica.AAC.2